MTVECFRLCILLEGSELLHSYWLEARAYIIEPLLRQIERHSDAGSIKAELCLIVYYSIERSAHGVLDTSDWTSDVGVFRQWLDAVRFSGTGQAALCEALAECVYMHRQRSSRLCDTADVSQQCLVVTSGDASMHAMGVVLPCGVQRLDVADLHLPNIVTLQELAYNLPLLGVEMSIVTRRLGTEEISLRGLCRLAYKNSRALCNGNTPALTFETCEVALPGTHWRVLLGPCWSAGRAVMHAVAKELAAQRDTAQHGQSNGAAQQRQTPPMAASSPVNTPAATPVETPYSTTPMGSTAHMQPAAMVNVTAANHYPAPATSHHPHAQSASVAMAPPQHHHNPTMLPPQQHTVAATSAMNGHSTAAGAAYMQSTAQQQQQQQQHNAAQQHHVASGAASQSSMASLWQGVASRYSNSSGAMKHYCALSVFGQTHLAAVTQQWMSNPTVIGFEDYMKFKQKLNDTGTVPSQFFAKVRVLQDGASMMEQLKQPNMMLRMDAGTHMLYMMTRSERAGSTGRSAPSVYHLYAVTKHHAA